MLGEFVLLVGEGMSQDRLTAWKTTGFMSGTAFGRGVVNTSRNA